MFLIYIQISLFAHIDEAVYLLNTYIEQKKITIKIHIINNAVRSTSDSTVIIMLPICNNISTVCNILLSKLTTNNKYYSNSVYLSTNNL